MSEAYMLSALGKSSSASRPAKSCNTKTKKGDSNKFESILDKFKEVKNKSSTDDEEQNTEQCAANVSSDNQMQEQIQEQIQEQECKGIDEVTEEPVSEKINSVNLTSLSNVNIEQQVKVLSDTKENTQTTQTDVINDTSKTESVNLVQSEQKTNFINTSFEVQGEDKTETKNNIVHNEETIETAKNNVLTVQNEDKTENIKKNSFILQNEEKTNIIKNSSIVVQDEEKNNSQNSNEFTNQKDAKNNAKDSKNNNLLNITEKADDSENTTQKTASKVKEVTKNNISSGSKEEFNMIHEQAIRSTDKTTSIAEKGNINLKNSTTVPLNEDNSYSYSKDIDTKDMSIIQQLAKSITTGKIGNGSSITVKLKPEYLGEMTINIQNTAEGCIARISAGRNEVKRILTSRINEISAVLSNRMIKVDQIVIDNNIQQEVNSNNDTNNGYNSRDFSGGSYNQEYSQDGENENVGLQAKNESIKSDEEKDSSQNLSYGGINYYV